MAKIILSIDGPAIKEPGCALYELRDARKIARPVPDDLERADKWVAPIEGKEYYTPIEGPDGREIRQMDPSGRYRPELWAGTAAFAGMEIPCRAPFATMSPTDDPAIPPNRAGEYEKFVCLQEIGGSPWATPDRSKRRVYFNEDVMTKATGLELTFYNTGNISSATFKGSPVSNSQARKMLDTFSSTRLWYDADDRKFHSKGPIDTAGFKEVVAWIKKKRDETCPGVF